MANDKIFQIIQELEELQNDSTVPKNVKMRIENSLAALKGNCEVSIRINKALNELDEIAEDSNMQAYTRTQIWNIVSLLEMI